MVPFRQVRTLMVSRHRSRTSGRLDVICAGRARRAGGLQSDSGVTLIEVLVAVVLLVIVGLSVTRFVIQTGASSSQSRLRLEATNVAETEIESLQGMSTFGNIPSGQQNLPAVTVAENGGTHNQTFHVTATYTLQADVTDGGNSVCTLASGAAVPPEIWNVIVAVSWKNGGGAVGGTVTEGTYLAPEAGGAIPATSGELAVPVENSLGAAYTTSVPISVVGTWAGSGSAPTVPSTEETSAEGNTGNTGCAVFPGLDPATGWQYEVCIGSTTTCPATTAYTGAVTEQELPGVINASTATVSAFSEGPVNLTYGSVTLASPIEVDPGVSVPVSFVTQCSTSNCPTDPTPAADLPVTVEASQLTGANNAFSFDTYASPQQITAVTLFPQSDYECWAGDTPDSAPTYEVGITAIYPSVTPTSCDTMVSSPSANLPVYPVYLKATFSGSAPTPTATEYLGSHETIALNAITPASTGGISSTGLPLGEYQLGYKVGSGSNTLISEWIFVTPTGVYTSTTGVSVPTGVETAPGTSITVPL
jgi:Tfp pilus assembly protein PilV